MSRGRMLKISIAQTVAQCRVLLEGPLVGTGLRELRRIGARLRTELGGRTLVIDVKGANRISQEGENLLLQLINQGAKICPQSVLHELTRRSNKQVFDLIDTSLQDESRAGNSGGF